MAGQENSKVKSTRVEIESFRADPSKIDRTLSQYYSVVLSENKEILEEVARKNGFTKKEKEEITHILRYSAKIQELQDRIEYNKRSREVNAVEDTKQCQIKIEAYLKECNKYYKNNFQKYKTVENEIVRVRAQSSTKGKKTEKPKSKSR